MKENSIYAFLSHSNITNLNHLNFEKIIFLFFHIHSTILLLLFYYCFLFYKKIHMSTSFDDDKIENSNSTISESFSEEPILLLTGEKALEITNEGIQFLTSIKDKNVAILSIVGPSSSGKSYLLNQLLGTKKGFLVSQESPSSKGLTIWGSPLKIEGQDTDIIIIDSEGFSKKNAPSLHDIKFFTIISLISSSIIYNSNREINAEIDLLSKMCESIQKINIKDGRKITGAYLPELLWVSRDFFNKEKNCGRLFATIEEKIKGNELINNLFINRKYFYLNSPFPDDKMKNGGVNNLDEMNPEYKGNFHRLKKYIFENIQPKKMLNVNVNGKILYGLLQDFSEKLSPPEEILEIHSSLENVLLANANDISERIISKNSKKIVEIINNKNYNVCEIYEQIINSLEEEIENFFSYGVGDTLFCKDIIIYLKKIISNASGEVQKLLKMWHKKYYESYVNRFIQKQEKNEGIKSLENINEYFTAYSSELRGYLLKILSFQKYKFSDKFLGAVNEFVCNKIKNIGETIAILLEGMVNENNDLKDKLNQKDNLLNERNNEIRDKRLNILELKSNYEKLCFSTNSKEKEYLNKLSIAEKKLENTKLQSKEVINEKEKKIKELKETIEFLNKEISNLNKEIKTKSNEIKKIRMELEGYKGQEGNVGMNIIMDNNKYSKIDFKIGNMKNIFNTIRETFNEYKEAVDKLDKERDTVLHTKSIEISFKETEERHKKWQDDFKVLVEEQLKALNENYEGLITKAKNQISSLSFEITKLNYDLNDEKQNYSVLQSKYEEAKKEVQEYKKLSLVKDSLINTQKESIKLYQDKIQKYQQIQNNLEIELNQNIVKYKMKEDEIHTLVLVVEKIMTKKKESYEFSVKKLSHEIKGEVEALVRELRIFK